MFLRFNRFSILRLQSSFKRFSSHETNAYSELPTEADVVVIGGGSIGCSTLYHLTKMGVKNAVLLERNRLTSGTTWHTAGLYWRLRPNDIEVEMLTYSRKLLTEILPVDSEMDPGWINNGGLFIASTKERLDEYKRLMTLGKAYGIESHVLDPSETKKLYPLMNVDDVYGTLFSPGDGMIDPSSFCGALAKAAKKFGAKVIEHCPVAKILTVTDDFGAKRAIGVQTVDGRTIKAKSVVNCAGGWAPKLVKDLGVLAPTIFMHHAYAITETIDGIRNMPNVRDHDSAIYFKTSGDVLAFGGYELNAVSWEDVKEDFVFGLFDLDWDRFSVHINGACNRLPILKKTGIKSNICGPMSFTPDHRPLMGETPNVRGLFMACGMELGMMLGGALGYQTAHWVFHGRPEAHLYSYDIRRFNPKVANQYIWLKDKIHEAIATMYRIHWPRDEPMSGRNQIKGPFHDALLADGCVFQERHGWERAGWFVRDQKTAPILPYDYYGAYGHIKNENYVYEQRIGVDYTWQYPEIHDLVGEDCMLVRNKVGVFDMSYFGKYYLSGPDAQKAVDWIFSNDMRKAVGTTTYTCMLNERGGVETDLTVSVLKSGKGLSSCDPKFYGDTGFYIAAGGGSQYHTLTHIRNKIQDRKFNVKLEDRTSEMGILSVQGPTSRQLLQEIVDEDLSNEALPFSCHKLVKVGGNALCRILRVSFVGELGFELHVPKESCMQVYENLHLTGKKFGLRNVGYRALESLAAEKGYRFWDSDVRFSDTPLEAALAYTCKLKSDQQFIGRQALEKQRTEGIRKRIACFTLNKHRALYGLETVFRNDEPVGVVRRAEFAYILNAPIAYAYISRKDNEKISNDWILNGKYEIESLGERFEANVFLRSPFDVDNKRIAGIYS